MSNIRLNVVVVLDRSGSMKGSETQTVDCLNKYFRSLDENTESDAYVTMTMFDSEGIDLIFDNKIASGARLDRETYIPRSMTPLLDAVADGIDRLKNMAADGELAALVVLTDGFENSSTMFSHKEIANKLSKKSEEDNWMVLFLGADIDAWNDAKKMGIGYENTLSLDKSRMDDLSDVLCDVSAEYIRSKDSKAAVFTDNHRMKVARKGSNL